MYCDIKWSYRYTCVVCMRRSSNVLCKFEFPSLHMYTGILYRQPCKATVLDCSCLLFDPSVYLIITSFQLSLPHDSLQHSVNSLEFFLWDTMGSKKTNLSLLKCFGISPLVSRDEIGSMAACNFSFAACRRLFVRRMVGVMYAAVQQWMSTHYSTVVSYHNNP